MGKGKSKVKKLTAKRLVKDQKKRKFGGKQK